MLLLLLIIIITLSQQKYIHSLYTEKVLNNFCSFSHLLCKIHYLLLVSTVCQRNPKTGERKTKAKQKTKTQVWQENQTHSSEGRHNSVTKSHDGSQILLVSLSSFHSGQKEPDKKRQRAFIKPFSPPLLQSSIVFIPSQSASIPTTHTMPDLE